MNRGAKVLVAMSGGVDSTAAAILLRQRGYEVGGATFLLWGPDDGIGEQQGVPQAQEVCRKLGIPHYLLDYRMLFRTHVLDYFAGAYCLGETPNPCVACNRHIKFPAFAASADALGYGYIATGHYASVEYGEEHGYRLRRARHRHKDQSYVLYTLTQELLSRLLLPLGGCEKEEARALVARCGIDIPRAAESQDICFVPDGDYAGFLSRYTGQSCPPGEFVDEAGAVLGRHKGIWHYTVGQRRGLGTGFGRPLYVSRIDGETGRITLSGNDALFSDRLQARDLRFLSGPVPAGPLRAAARIRYSHREAPATVRPCPDGTAGVVFDTPQCAPAPGQAVVFYDGDYLLGGGIITQ